MTDRILRHPSVPVEAPEWAWDAAGYDADGSADTISAASRCFHDDLPLFLLASADGLTGAAAVAWVVRERTRIVEERARLVAQARETEAIAALAGAISGAAEDDVLRRLLGRLTDRTQYAVRQQLGR